MQDSFHHVRIIIAKSAKLAIRHQLKRAENVSAYFAMDNGHGLGCRE